MSDSLAIAVAGCAGRMGRHHLRTIDNDPDASLLGGFEHQGSPLLGKPLIELVGAGLASVGSSTLKVEASLAPFLKKIDVLIDFTTPYATLGHVALMAEAGRGMVIGTTGFKPEQEVEIAKAAQRIPIVKSGNMSLGVNLLMALVERAAASLGNDFDVEIHEAHHRHKVDAPSGTALMLGAATARGRGVSLGEKEVRVRDGIMNAREAGQIGFSVTRAGGIVGDHQVLFGSDGEVLTLSHVALDRSLFSRGALTAAKWLDDKPPGLYSMGDVLGL